MARAIGIDLGTTNSAVGLKRLDTDIIPNAEGELLTPSVVGCSKRGRWSKSGTMIVGKHALEWQVQDPENTLVSVKRLMGRSFEDEEVQRLLREGRYAYSVKPLAAGSKQSLAVVLDGEEYRPEQISGEILAKLKRDCEAHLGEPVEYAVVTVPAYFNDKQKRATRMAAAIAGLKVQRLLPEPTAAAISFGVGDLGEGESETVLVFDMGGGTFDISVLTMTEGHFIEQGKGGDMWMGGDDIDHLLSDHVLRQTEEDNEIEGLRELIEQLPAAEKNRFLGDLRSGVEAAKIRLSTERSAVIEILGLLKDADGDILDVEVEVTREQFEALLEPFAERAAELTRAVLASIQFEPDLIDRVVMVGGSSYIPLIVDKMKGVFGDDKVQVHKRPLLAIAEGAAILAHRLADAYECPGCGQEVTQSDQTCAACGFDLAQDLARKGVVDIVHTTSHDYYLELEDGSDHLLVERNMPLPFKTQGTFRLMHPEQRLAHFRFCNLVNEERESIGDLWLSFDPDEDTRNTKDDNKGSESTEEVREVVLDFEIDEDNLITVGASLADRPEVRVSRTLSRGHADERLFLELEGAIQRVNDEEHKYFTKYDFLFRSGEIARAINDVIDQETGAEDLKASRGAERQLAVAAELVAREESPTSNLFYLEDLLAAYGGLLEPGQREPLVKRIERLRERNRTGTVKEILDARDKAHGEADKYPALGILMSVGDAAETLARTDPAKAPRYDKHLRDLRNAMLKNDVETFERLTQAIMPEVSAILRNRSKADLQIFKGVRK
ncbi:Hsp70 family protein [Thiorhodococcus mannitoliphagus]|uniref:Hsp70 family protein n=1 Tax=Thiorhodococcus mannitoliphagus TaxID=329406 RepID=A0A6P1E3B6_9GAMM|nr:Hsp70 family protein [Thiorhodococcus mannitoliphagus]NEX22982.1 Hsp70 family protein [Thiorhodococcus mannitoliphagus]